MKRLLQTLAVTLVTMSGVVGVAAAQDCTVGNTGPNSNNTCTSTNTNTSTITCDNDVTVTNNDTQNSNSGNSNNNNNTNSGNASSGGASNSNSSTSDLNVGCEPSNQTTPTTPETPTTPTTTNPGVVSAATTTPKVASLPKTGANTILATTGIAAAILGSVAAISRLVVLSYGYRR